MDENQNECTHESVIEESTLGGKVMVWCEDCDWHVTRDKVRA